MLQSIGVTMEWMVGDTFISIVFVPYGEHDMIFVWYPRNVVTRCSGAFWLSLGATLTPEYNATGAYYNASESGAALAMGKAEYYYTYNMSDPHNKASIVVVPKHPS